MRITALAAAAALCLGTALPAFAAISVPASPLPASSPIIEAAVNCGPHAHYIRGHRAPDHQWVKGRCVRDKRH